MQDGNKTTSSDTARSTTVETPEEVNLRAQREVDALRADRERRSNDPRDKGRGGRSSPRKFTDAERVAAVVDLQKKVLQDNATLRKELHEGMAALQQQMKNGNVVIYSQGVLIDALVLALERTDPTLFADIKARVASAYEQLVAARTAARLDAIEKTTTHEQREAAAREQAMQVAMKELGITSVVADQTLAEAAGVPEGTIIL